MATKNYVKSAFFGILVVLALSGANVAQAFDPGPSPSIISISPGFKMVNSPEFTLSVSGNDFASDSKVYFNGSVRPTTPGGDIHELMATIFASDLTAVGTFNITVTNQTSGAISNSVPFYVTATNPAPNITSISPSSVTLSSCPCNITVNGSNFTSSSVGWASIYNPDGTQWGATSGDTTFISSNQLQVTIPYVAAGPPGGPPAGFYALAYISDPTFGNSNAVSLTVGRSSARGAVVGSFGSSPMPNTALTISDLINDLFNFIWPIIVAFIIIMFIIAGFMFITAQGEPSKVAQARSFVIYGIVGIVVIIVAYSIIFLVRNSFPSLSP